MKIGLDAKRAFRNGTGLGNYSRFIIQGMASAYPENEYYLFTPSVSGEFAHLIPAAANIHIVSPDSLPGRTFPSLWRTYAIAELCNTLELDVYHGLSNELPVGIEKFRGRKLVTIHDLIFLRYPGYYNNIDRYIYKRKFTHACQKADLILAVSGQTRTDIMAYFHITPEKIQVTGQNCSDVFSAPVTGIQQQEITALYKLPGAYILCVGTLEKRKNQLTVLKAFHKLNKPGMNLVFVGRNSDYSSQLKAFIEANNLRDRVFFLENVQSVHLPAIYQNASLFVYASEFEGFGIPILEALRSRVPILAANTSSLPEVGGDAAMYFDYDNSAELSEKMGVLLNNQAKRKEMIEKGVAQAARFNTPLLMKELMDIYRG